MREQLNIGEPVSVEGNREGLTAVSGHVVSISDEGFEIQVDAAEGRAVYGQDVVPVLWADVGRLTRDPASRVTLTTSPNIEGHEVEQYLGIIGGQAVMGVNMFKDFAAGLRDVVGGRSGVYEREWDRARGFALQELRAKAWRAGADAVIAVKVDHENFTSMLVVTATGTAVQLRPEGR